MKKISNGSVIAWVVLGVGVLFLVALFVFNSINRPPSPHIATGFWNEKMVIGDKNAQNKMVSYSDYFCSFCESFAEQTASEKFKKDYIDSGKVSYEVRSVTVLSEIAPNTEQGVQSAHCAADQDGFQAFSEHIVPRIKKDFFDKGIGLKGTPPIEKLAIDYFQESARAAKLDVDKFTTCMKDQKHQDQIKKDTDRAIALGVTGLPYIAINDYSTSGFQGGWRGMETILKAGGVL